MTDRSQTKYGSQLEDHDWTASGEDVESVERTRVKGHEIDVVYYVTDPDADGGYGREKYTATVCYNEGREPYVLYVVEHRWKGNYWRDVTDWDWRDVPGPVRQEIANRLPVTTPSELDSGVRLMDEGGESRWEKHHKHRVEAMSGGEMWGTSYLRDALGNLERAAEAFDDGSTAESLTESLVETLQKLIRRVESDD